jgi:hypothetical protein
MRGDVNGKPYDFGDAFKDLPPEKRVGVIETARGLLKIQKKNRAMTANNPRANKKQGRQVLPEE